MKRWWQQKSRQAKVITVLAVLLALQIGLCVSTQTLVSWASAIFHLHRTGEPIDSLGLMVWQCVFCLVTFFLIVVTGVFSLPGLRAMRKKSRKDSGA